MANERYLRFDHDIRSISNLTVLQKLIMTHVMSFEDKALPCFTKPRTLAEFFGVDAEMIIVEIEHLVALGLLSIKDDGSRRYLSLKVVPKNSIEDYFEKDVFDV